MPYYSKEDNKEISKVAQYLDPDEKVDIVAKGSKIMFLTNKRLLIKKLSLLKRETIQAILYDKIVSIQLKKGFQSSKILLFIPGYEIAIDSLKKEVAERVLAYLKEVTHNNNKSKIKEKDVIDSDSIDDNVTTKSIDDNVTTRPSPNIDLAEDSKTIPPFPIENELEKLSNLKNETVISERAKTKEKEKEYSPDIEKFVLKGNDRDEVNKISEMLNPDEKVLLVARQSKIKPGGSYFTPNTIYATDRRIIIRDPYMLGIKADVVDIPYDIITSLKLEKGLLSSTIRFKAPGLMSSTKLGMMDSIVEGEDDTEGIIEAIPKDKAEDLLEIIRSGMQQNSRRLAPSKKQKFTELNEPKDDIGMYIQSVSIADEISKLVKLKEEGILSEEEFNEMKKDLIRNSRR